MCTPSILKLNSDQPLDCPAAQIERREGGRSCGWEAGADLSVLSSLFLWSVTESSLVNICAFALCHEDGNNLTLLANLLATKKSNIVDPWKL